MTARKTTPNPTKPKFQVVEYNLHYITNAGEELKFNLDIPTGIIFNLKGDDEQSQFVEMLKAMGDHETLAKFEKLGSLSEGTPLIKRYFAEYEKLAGASVGE